MKKQTVAFLIFLMTLSLLAGCGQTAPVPTEGTTAAAPVAAAAAPTEETTTLVHTVDEFLGALSCGADITLAPGTYDLSAASDFGQPTQSADYTWSDPGCTLVLRDLDGLTLRGEGAVLTTDQESAVVLRLENCTDLRMEGLSFRRTDRNFSRNCLELVNCRKALLEGLYLEDIANLLELRDSSDIRVRGCEFTGPAAMALATDGCTSIVVEDCLLHDLGETTGDPDGPGAYADLIVVGTSGETESRDVTIQNCRLENNHTGGLFGVGFSRNVIFQNNEILNSTVRDAAFRFTSAAPHLVGNRYEGNGPWAWYQNYSEYGVDENGADITPALLYAMEPIPEAGPRKEVHVTTADQFLAALEPDTHVILDCSLLDLSTASGYGEDRTEFWFWEETCDGPQLVIRGINNLTISGDGPDIVTISAVPRYANVLSFRFCPNLTLSGFTAGHTIEPGFCMGGVLDLKECRRVRIENCGLYGCGILGISTQGGTGLQVTDCDIYECSSGGMMLRGTGEVSIDRTVFQDLGGPEVETVGCWDVLWDGMPVED